MEAQPRVDLLQLRLDVRELLGEPRELVRQTVILALVVLDRVLGKAGAKLEVLGLDPDQRNAAERLLDLLRGVVVAEAERAERGVARLRLRVRRILRVGIDLRERLDLGLGGEPS